MYCWPNLLLCCAECGRFKGNRLPVRNGEADLVDPTAEDPWQHLDFDPATGVVVARFDLVTNAESVKGSETVRLLQLDRRESPNDGYLKTWRRLVAAVWQHGCLTSRQRALRPGRGGGAPARALPPLPLQASRSLSTDATIRPSSAMGTGAQSRIAEGAAADSAGGCRHSHQAPTVFSTASSAQATAIRKLR